MLIPILLGSAGLVDTRAQFNDVATVYAAIAVGVFVLVLLLVVTMVLRYRAREGGPDASRVSDAPRLEGLYVLALSCVAAFLVAFTFIHESKSDAALGAHTGLTVRVTAAKWHWSFFYRASGISELGTDTSPPTLYVPVDTNIDFRLISVDVIHAFWIPMTRFKRDAYPEVTQDFTLSFQKPGFVRNAGECAEFCGLLHGQMRFDVDAMTRRQFQLWVSTHSRPA